MRKLDALVNDYDGVVDRVAAELGVDRIDLHALFDDEAARADFTDSCHSNRAGAGRIATVVVDRIVAAH